MIVRVIMVMYPGYEPDMRILRGTARETGVLETRRRRRVIVIVMIGGKVKESSAFM